MSQARKKRRSRRQPEVFAHLKNTTSTPPPSSSTITAWIEQLPTSHEPPPSSDSRHLKSPGKALAPGSSNPQRLPPTSAYHPQAPTATRPLKRKAHLPLKTNTKSPVRRSQQSTITSVGQSSLRRSARLASTRSKTKDTSDAGNSADTQSSDTFIGRPPNSLFRPKNAFAEVQKPQQVYIALKEWAWKVGISLKGRTWKVLIPQQSAKREYIKYWHQTQRLPRTNVTIYNLPWNRQSQGVQDFEGSQAVLEESLGAGGSRNQGRASRAISE
ncbi:MAG: hypothetical protein Q9222_002208 [Ikaeria aurantiellina]